MEHHIVFKEQETYSGWPANHGSWQWGDEFLVGFLSGPYRREGYEGFHRISTPFVKQQARSLDGGITWKVEDPGVDFNAEARHLAGVNLPRLDLSRDILRVCGVYDTGGDLCTPLGGFYFSRDKGKSWNGPYPFTGIVDQFEPPYMNTSRTAVLDDLIFLSQANSEGWGSDSVFVARYEFGRFHYVGLVCKDGFRAVMPAVAHTHGRIVAALRRRNMFMNLECWIDTYASEDEGITWQFLSKVGWTGKSNGNPPALLALANGHLVCAYANRNRGEMRAVVSKDKGLTWSPELVLNKGISDIGYPRLFLRTDGRVACVYYFARNLSKEVQHIVCTIFDPEVEFEQAEE